MTSHEHPSKVKLNIFENILFSVLKVGGWVRGFREEGGRGYFGWKGGYGALRDWVGVVK